MNTRNIYLYWSGKEYKLISILRNLIYLHSRNGKGYNVILITDKNISEYIKDIPYYFKDLCFAHQADFARVNVICDYGGLWLDSDTLVLDTLDSLFDLIENKEGFFIKQGNKVLCNGLFGSKANTPLMMEWKKQMKDLLNMKNGKISWCDIGTIMLENMYNTNSALYNNYTIFNGLDNVYPIDWNNCVSEFIDKPYDNYKTIIRDYQPLIVLVHSVYHKLENKTEKEILSDNLPLNYFINKSFENMNVIDYDFIEIGTSNFDTLIEKADNNTK
jgi:mannosyltransferase OCH1-like enzyme